MELPISIIEHNIDRGTVLHSSALFDKINHGKFFVVIGVSGDKIAGFFHKLKY